jgi:hypothetical protein
MSIEQALRTRLAAFLGAVNTTNSLGFLKVYATPPPSWPAMQSIAIEIESEEADDFPMDGVHCSRRTLNVKVACFWGNVLPSERTQNIEDKAFIIREAIEQSSYLIDEDIKDSPHFEKIIIDGITKRYNPEGYVEAAIISTKWVLHEEWIRDNALATPVAPSLLNAYESTASDITIHFAAGGPADGLRMYLNGVLIATLAITATSYTFTHLSSATGYPVKISAYNAVTESFSGILTATTS